MNRLFLFMLATLMALTSLLVGCGSVTTVENPIWHVGNMDVSWMCGTWETEPVGNLTDGAWVTTDSTLQLQLRVLGTVPGSYQPVGDDDDSAETEWVETGRFVGVVTFLNGCFIYNFDEEDPESHCNDESYAYDLYTNTGYYSYFLVEGAATYDNVNQDITLLGAWGTPAQVTDGEVVFDTQTGMVDSLLWNFGDEVQALGDSDYLHVEWGWQQFGYTDYFNVDDLNMFTDIENELVLGNASMTVGNSYTACDIQPGS